MHKKKIIFLLLLTVWLFSSGRTFAQPPCTLSVQITPPQATLSCQNPSIQLNVTVTPPGGQLDYSWSGPAPLPPVPNPVVTQPGTYTVFVSDSLAGCWGVATAFVVSDQSVPNVTISASNLSCDIPNNPVTLTATATGGSGNFGYAWTGGQNTPQIQVSDPGTYCMVVTDLTTGCSASRCFTLTLPAPLTGAIDYYNGFFCGDSSVMCASIAGGIPPFSYAWNNGNTTPCVFDPTAGTYVVTVTDNWGCSLVLSQVAEDDPNECARIAGTVRADWNTNCTLEASDENFGHIVIRIEDTAGEEFFAYANADGEYDVEVFPGAYTVSIIPPNNLWEPCQSAVAVNLLPNQMTTQDFLLKPLADCPAMSVDIASAWLRRCFEGNYQVKYCNQGTADATDAYIDIQFDPFLSVTSAELPYTSLGNNQYRFQLGDVPFNTCDYFWIKVLTSCNATLGQTHCTEAVIHPTGDCLPPNAQWSGASLQIQADCNTDSLDFTIRNIGTGATVEPLEYVIIEDAVMLMQAPPPSIFLTPGAVHHVKVPANGSTWRLEVAQEPFHPGQSMPSLAVEGCTTGAQFSTGFVNQFPQNDNDPWVDTDCTQNVGSYDPNDKQGFPLGYQSERYIEPGQDLEYLIRFQNTGTDTAFTVVIRDELSPWLDPGSVTPGASSHPYRFDFYDDRSIKFVFENINLPDSSKSQEASQGFVSFRISQKANVPLQTEILNQAGIYFDFNEPIYTNTTRHRVGKDFVTVSAWQPFQEGLSLRMMPHPVGTSALLQIDGLSGNTEWSAEIFDARGALVRSEQVNGAQWRFERGELTAGLYFLRVVSGNKVLGAGKIVLRHTE